MATVTKNGPRQKRDKHLLYHGELTDAPGRNEIWDDYLKYLGYGQWELISEGTDFSGMSDFEPVKQKMSTRDLIAWVIEYDDSEEGENPIQDKPEENGQDKDGEKIKTRILGPHSKRLYEIAKAEGADFCIKCLDRWTHYDWPPEKKPKAVHLLDIKGVTRRGVWARIFHPVFDVETNLGPAYLYPPDSRHGANLILKLEKQGSALRVVKVPQDLMAKIESLMPALNLLKEKTHR